MDKTQNLEVTLQDLAILRNAIEKLQIFGKDSIIVANIYSRIVMMMANDADVNAAKNKK